MFYVNNWILGASLFLISIVSLVLLFQKSRGFEPQRLLGVAFLAIICYGLTYLAISTGTLTEFPFLYRIGCPFYYLVPPCFYLYFRFLLQDKRSLRKADLFHLIPFALAVLDMGGYYWGTTAEAKMEELLRVQNSPILVFDTGAGFLPAISHFYFRVLQMAVYTPDTISKSSSSASSLYVNFFTGSAKDEVRYRINKGKWVSMRHTIDLDPAYVEGVAAWKKMTDKKARGRRPSNPARSTHLWKAPIISTLTPGKYQIQIKAKDMFGRVFKEKRELHITK